MRPHWFDHVCPFGALAKEAQTYFDAFLQNMRIYFGAHFVCVCDMSIAYSNSGPTVNTATNDTCQVCIPQQENLSLQMDTTPQFSSVFQFNFTPYVNSMRHMNAMPQVYAVSIPVEDSSAIMIGTELLKRTTIVPAREEFNYLNMKPRDLITNYINVRKDELQACDISKQFITISLDTVGLLMADRLIMDRLMSDRLNDRRTKDE